MANYTIHDPPNFSSELRMITASDPVHADLVNMLFNRLITNDAFLKAVTDLLLVHVHTGAGGGPPPIGTSGIADSAVTPIKLNLGGGYQIVYNPFGSGSLDIERPCEGIPYVHTETTFITGKFDHMEVV